MIKTNNLRYIIKILQQQIHWNQFCHLHWCLQQQSSHQRLNLRLLQDLKALSLVHLLKWIHLHSCPLLGMRLSILQFFRLTGMTYLFIFNIINYLFFLCFYNIFKMAYLPYGKSRRISWKISAPKYEDKVTLTSVKNFPHEY